MTTFNCSWCGRDSGLQGNTIVAAPEDTYRWTVKCPRCAKADDERRKSRLEHSGLLAEFTKAALSSSWSLHEGGKDITREMTATSLARKVADSAQATLDEYLKRLDGRDSDMALLESLEWSYYDLPSESMLCPVCTGAQLTVAGKKNEGHKADCKLARRLGR